MCMSSPNMPAPPPQPQESKQPDSMATRRKQRQAAGMGGGTMLAGSGGVPAGSLNTGGTTLLGG